MADGNLRKVKTLVNPPPVKEKPAETLQEKLAKMEQQQAAVLANCQLQQRNYDRITGAVLMLKELIAGEEVEEKANGKVQEEEGVAPVLTRQRQAGTE